MKDYHVELSMVIAAKDEEEARRIAWDEVEKMGLSSVESVNEIEW